MKKIFALCLALLLLTGCGSGSVTPVAGTGVTLLTKDIRPASVQGAAEADGAALRSFGLSLLRRAEEDNPVISPLSAYLALGMAANGAAGTTAEEFAALLGGESERVNELAKAMGETLSTDEVNTFRTANSAWVDGEAAIREDYLQQLVTWYGAQAYAAELETEKAKNAMNGWVKEQTEGMIPTLFEQPLDKDTMLVLINTLYMKAEWQAKFVKEGTRKDVFHAGSGDETVDFMHKTANLLYLSGAGYEGVALPYAGDTLRFVALKPTEGTARELLETLDGETLAALVSAEERSRVALSLPKFTIDYAMNMNDALQEMGLTAAFDPDAADFSPMGTSAEGDPLYISQVLQKVKIIVDEEGTEAAAATAVLAAGATAMMDPPIELRFDEPFVYFIVDTAYQIPLFAGILDNPA